MKIGYALSSEQFSPSELLDQARRARDAGFEALSISDHFHPWNDEQGNSPFVWSMIGALSQTTPELALSTMVTCPIVRINPVILAQAAATSALLLNGSFVFGVGTGENLNEHVWGAPWPPIRERVERLREAIELMRLLWSGDNVDFEGVYYKAVNARLYSLPDKPPPVFVSAFGTLATDLAAEVGDGFVTFTPELLLRYREGGGRGSAQTAVKVCFDADEDRAKEMIHRLWRMELNPGQLNQELAVPRHIESASTLVTPEMTSKAFPCGPDPERHVAALQQRIDDGFDEIYVQQVGADMEGFFDLYSLKVLPQLKEGHAKAKRDADTYVST
ncbi:MAG TPA: TIGR03557 family F420-dependent LLM class oxidoreductase [Acidimicrobiales bacterium]|nr:TIGR03557 family F420-dependent LLM class oxidoreductase [Acidimicrobiales bacterium]